MRKVLVIFCCLAAVSFAQGWPNWRGDAGMSGRVEVELQMPLVQKWQYLSEYNFTGTPVGGDGRIFVLSRDGRILCVGIDGKEIWKKLLMHKTQAGAEKNIVFTGPAAVSEGVLVACGEDGSVFGLSPVDGAEKWRYEAGGSINGAPVIDGGRVMVLTKAEGRVHCIDLEKGARIWISDVDVRADGHPAVYDGSVIYGNCNSVLSFLDAATGKLKGITEFGTGHEIAGTPACGGGRVYVGTRAGYVMSVDSAKRKAVWEKDAGGGELFAAPAVYDKSVIVSGGDLKVMRIEDGRSKWEYQADNPLTPPVAVGKHAVFVAGGQLVVLDAGSGNKVGSVKCADSDYPPAVIDGRVIVAGGDGSLYCFGQE